MKLVNMVKEKGYENSIEEAIRIAAPYLMNEKNIIEIMDDFQHRGIIAPEIRQYFEIKLETAAIIMRIERLFGEYGHEVHGVIYLLDRDVKSTQGDYGTVHYIAAPHLGEDIVKGMTNFEIGPYKGLCGKAVFLKSVYVSNDLEKEECFTREQLELFEKYKIQSCASVPILVNNKVVATCALFSHKPLGILSLKLNERLMNKIHRLEKTFDRLQYEWKHIRKIAISAIISKEGKLKYVDSNLEYSLGVHPKDLITEDRAPFALVCEEDKPYILEAFQKCVKEKVSTSVVHRVQAPEVGEVVLQTDYEPILNENGEVRYVAATYISNTIRCKQFERDLKIIEENISLF